MGRGARKLRKGESVVHRPTQRTGKVVSNLSSDVFIEFADGSSWQYPRADVRAKPRASKSPKNGAS